MIKLKTILYELNLIKNPTPNDVVKLIIKIRNYIHNIDYDNDNDWGKFIDIMVNYDFYNYKGIKEYSVYNDESVREFSNNLNKNQLIELYKDLLIYKSKINLNEIKLIGKNQFPKNIDWKYKITTPSQFKNTAEILLKLGYEDINIFILDEDSKDISNYPIIIFHNHQYDDNTLSYNFNGIGWNEVKYGYGDYIKLN